MPLLKFLKKVFKAKAPVKRKSTKKIKKRTSAKLSKKIRKKHAKKTPKKLTRKAVKKNLKKAPKSAKASGAPKEKEIGTVTHYFGKISVGIIKLKAPLGLGDAIHIKGVHDDFTQEISSLQYNHKDIVSAKKGLEVGIKVIQRVHENDKVYRVTR
jgi:putative protease